MKNENTSQTMQANAQEIESALIQWDNQEVSSIEFPQAFNFPESFQSSSPAVVVCRNFPDSKESLPVTNADRTTYTIDRNEDVEGQQHFNMLSIASKEEGGPNYSRVLDQFENSVAVIQWGTARSETNDTQRFSFYRHFDNNCYAVVNNPRGADAENNLPIVSADNNSFTINRASGTDDQDFYWIAIGDCNVRNGYFSFEIGNGYVIKGGVSTSTLDDDQSFYFSTMGLSNFSTECSVVITNRQEKNSKSILPVTNMSASGFTLNRTDNITGDEKFWWIALGR